MGAVGLTQDLTCTAARGKALTHGIQENTLALTAFLSRMPESHPDRRVFLGSLSESSYLASISAGLEYIQLAAAVSHNSRIFLKPNLTFPVYRPGVMTSPEAIEAAIVALREYTPHIYIGDSDSGGYNRFSMDEVYRKTGLVNFAAKYGVKVVNLSTLPTRKITFSCGRRNLSLGLPALLTDEIDSLITMPVPKVHANTGVSLSFKNQWGCIPNPADRLRLHPLFRHVVVEVNRAVRARFSLIDGRFGLNVNGPMRGRAVELNWILAADDLGAADLIACRLMQIPIASVPHLMYARKLGWIPPAERICLNQPTEQFLREKFFCRPDWTDYPGMLAFRSRRIAHLAYFSPLSAFLHRVLYLFREPFYDYSVSRSRRDS